MLSFKEFCKMNEGDKLVVTLKVKVIPKVFSTDTDTYLDIKELKNLEKVMNLKKYLNSDASSKNFLEVNGFPIIHTIDKIRVLEDKIVLTFDSTVKEYNYKKFLNDLQQETQNTTKTQGADNYIDLSDSEDYYQTKDGSDEGELDGALLVITSITY